MQKKPPITINPITVGIALCGLAFVILLIVSLMQLFRTNPYGQSLKIDNIGSHIKGISADLKDYIEAALYKAASADTPGDAKTPTSGALVREGASLAEYDETASVDYGNFIVDVEAIQQSYTVKYRWSRKKDDPDPINRQATISCVSKELSIYGSSCSDIVIQNPQEAILSYLPYYGSLDTGEAIYAKNTRLISGETFLEVSVNSCGDQAKIKQTEQSIAKWLESLNFKPDELAIRYRDLCDGES